MAPSYSTLASSSSRFEGALQHRMFIRKHSWVRGEQQKPWTDEGGRDPLFPGGPDLSATDSHLLPTISQKVQVDGSSQKGFWLSGPTGSLFVPLSHSDENVPMSLLGMKTPACGRVD